MDAPEALTEKMLVFLIKVSKDPQGILANSKRSSEIVQEFTRLMEDRSLTDFTSSLEAWLTERLSRLPTDNLIKRLKEYAFIVSLKSGILCVIEALANRRYETLNAFNKTGDALIRRAIHEAVQEESEDFLINDYEWPSSSEEEPEQQEAGPDEYRPSLRPPLLDTEPHPDKASQPEPETGGAGAENEPSPTDTEEDSRHEPSPEETAEYSHHEPFPTETEEYSHQLPIVPDLTSMSRTRSDLDGLSGVADSTGATENPPSFPPYDFSEVSDEIERLSEPSHKAAKRRRLPKLPKLPRIIVTKTTPVQEEAELPQVPPITVTPATPLQEEAPPRRLPRIRVRPAELLEEEAPPDLDGAEDESHAGPSSAMDDAEGFSLPPLDEEPVPIARRRRRRRPTIDPITQLSSQEIRDNLENAKELSHPPGHLRALLLMQGQVKFQSARELLDTPSIDRRQPMRDWIMKRFKDTRDERSRESGSTASGQIQPEVGPSPNMGSIPIEPSQIGSGAGGTDASSAGQDRPIPGQNDSPPVAPAAPESPSVEDIPDVSIPDDGDNADVEPAEPGPEAHPNATSMTQDVTSSLMPVIPVHEEDSQEKPPTLPGIPGPSFSTTSVGPLELFDVDESQAVEPPHSPPVSTGNTSDPPPVSPERLQEAQRGTAVTMAQLIARHATHVHKQKKVRLRYACLSEVLESVEVNCVSTAISSLFDMNDRGEVFLIQPKSNTEQIFIFPTRQAEDEQ